MFFLYIYIKNYRCDGGMNDEGESGMECMMCVGRAREGGGPL